MSSKSSFLSPSSESPGKVNDAIPEGCRTPKKLRDWLLNNDEQNRWRQGNPEEIWKKLKASSQYQTAKEELEKKSIGYRLVGKHWPQWSPTVWTGIFGALATVLVGIPGWVAFVRPSSPPSFDPKPIITPKTQIAPTPKATSVPK